MAHDCSELVHEQQKLLGTLSAINEAFETLKTEEDKLNMGISLDTFLVLLGKRVKSNYETLGYYRYIESIE